MNLAWNPRADVTEKVYCSVRSCATLDSMADTCPSRLHDARHLRPAFCGGRLAGGSAKCPVVRHGEIAVALTKLWGAGSGKVLFLVGMLL